LRLAAAEVHSVLKKTLEAPVLLVGVVLPANRLAQ
jgi:hypothetical protein